jgi:hypothetical protein
MVKFNFVVSVSHIRGVDNNLADTLLFRDNRAYFLSNYPQAQATAGGVGGTATPDLISQLCYFLSALAPSSRHTYSSVLQHYVRSIYPHCFTSSRAPTCQFVSYLANFHSTITRLLGSPSPSPNCH